MPALAGPLLVSATTPAPSTCRRRAALASGPLKVAAAHGVRREPQRGSALRVSQTGAMCWRVRRHSLKRLSSSPAFRISSNGCAAHSGTGRPHHDGVQRVGERARRPRHLQEALVGLETADRSARAGRRSGRAVEERRRAGDAGRRGCPAGPILRARRSPLRPSAAQVTAASSARRARGEGPLRRLRSRPPRPVARRRAGRARPGRAMPPAGRP